MVEPGERRMEPWRSALVCNLKSKVFNNAEGPLKAQSSIQAQGLSTMVGTLKAQRVQIGVRREFCREGNNMCACSDGGPLECSGKRHTCEKPFKDDSFSLPLAYFTQYLAFQLH